VLASVEVLARAIRAASGAGSKGSGYDLAYWDKDHKYDIDTK
jgi:hypothetical protein